MRLLLLGLVSLSACDGLTWGPHGDPVSESGLLMSRSSAYAQLDSAAMSDDGQVFFAVMAGTTWCSFQAEDAYMDNDTTADTEIAVQDIYADVPLVVTRDGLAYIDSNGTTSDYWTVASVEAARFRSDAAGAVALTSDGRLNWFDGVTTTDRDRVGNCTALAFDRAGDVAWLACPTGLLRATPGEATVVAAGAVELVAWSDAAALAATVSTDRDTVAGVDTKGGTLWTFTSAARVLDVAPIAGRPFFAVLTAATDDAAAELLLLSADTGAVVDRIASEGTNLHAAHDAARLVVLGGYVTQVYDVE